MKSVGIVFGGSGYIGRNLLNFLISNGVFDTYFVFDLKELKGFDKEQTDGLVHFEKLDVRNDIDLPLIPNLDKDKSWIFNFAAIHREPGHTYQEYFDTNIPGAENINRCARTSGVKNIFFTSSIAPYGRSLHQRTESSTLYPETAYGISKALAEKIHLQWLYEDSTRRLIIVRPSVIFGPHDPGNVYRMIKSLKKGTFVLPNGGNVVKAYGYVYGLVESMLFTMNQKERLIVYNYTENPVVPLNEMVNIAKKTLEINKPTLKLPVAFLVVLASVIKVGFKVIGKTSDIHPVRVRKAGFPTNIKPDYLIKNNFDFKYNFKNALEHWKSVSPEDFA